MLFWVASNKDKKDVRDLIVNRPSATVNRTVPSKTAATIPMSTVPPNPNAPHDTTSSNQDNEESNIDNSWSKTYNRHIVPGDGDCFFSAVNCCMRFLDPDWQHDNVSLRNLSLIQLEQDVYKNHQFYFDYLPNSTSDANLDPATIDSLWDIIKAKYQNPGQYADNDLMMATVRALNLDVQLHGGSNTLLNIEDRTSQNTIHLLYCGLQIDNNPGNHYDALLPIINVNNNNPSIINDVVNTQANSTEDTENIIPSSQSTIVSEPDSISLTSSSNDAIINTETLLSKYLYHDSLLPHRNKIVLFLNKQNKATSLSKKRKTCKLCYCRFRALHLHGKSKSSKLLCQFLQSIRAQLLPLHLTNLVDPDTTQTSNSPSN